MTFTPRRQEVLRKGRSIRQSSVVGGYKVLSSQKVLSGSGRAERLRFMGKYIDHRLVARPEPDNNTFWTDSIVECRLYVQVGTQKFGGGTEGDVQVKMIFRKTPCKSILDETMPIERTPEWDL